LQKNFEILLNVKEPWYIRDLNLDSISKELDIRLILDVVQNFIP